MTLQEQLQNRIAVKQAVDSWQDAIREVALPLLKDGLITEGYIDAMIQNVIDNGAYIIIIPGFAMPHARPETGALDTGISMLKLVDPVEFPGEEKVSLLIALAAKDSDTHLDLIADLTELLVDDEKMEQIFAENDRDRLMELIG